MPSVNACCNVEDNSEMEHFHNGKLLLRNNTRHEVVIKKSFEKKIIRICIFMMSLTLRQYDYFHCFLILFIFS